MTDVCQTPDMPEAPRNERCAWLRQQFRAAFGRSAQPETVITSTPDPRIETMRPPEATMRKQSVQEKASIALTHIQRAFGRRPHPEAPIEDLKRITDPVVLSLLTSLAQRHGYTTMGQVVDMLMILARQARGIGALLGAIDEAYPEGVPDTMTADELFGILPGSVGVGVAQAMERYDFTYAREVVDHLRMLQRRRSEGA